MENPDEQTAEVIEQLRRLAWAVPISRDYMLKVVEGMPPFVGERAQQMAERLTLLCARLQGLLTKLPDDAAVLTAVAEDLECLRLAIESSLRDLDLLLEDLRRMLGQSDAGEAHPNTCN
jgi:hypothetical protein